MRASTGLERVNATFVVCAVGDADEQRDGIILLLLGRRVKAADEQHDNNGGGGGIYCRCRRARARNHERQLNVSFFSERRHLRGCEFAVARSWRLSRR